MNKNQNFLTPSIFFFNNDCFSFLQSLINQLRNYLKLDKNTFNYKHSLFGLNIHLPKVISVIFFTKMLKKITF